MDTAVMAKMTKVIREDEALCRQMARGAFAEDSLGPEEREALTLLAQRLQEGKGLPQHLRRASGALWWLDAPEPLMRGQS